MSNQPRKIPKDLQCTFFSLPRELRDKIYDCTWRNTVIIYTEPGSDSHILLIYGEEQTWFYPGIPLWTHVNRQWETESLAQFYRAGYLVISPLPVKVPGSPQKPQYFWDDPKYGELPVNWGYPAAKLAFGSELSRPVSVNVLGNMRWKPHNFDLAWDVRISNRPCYMGSGDDPDYDPQCCVTYCHIEAEKASVVVAQMKKLREMGCAPAQLEITLTFNPNERAHRLMANEEMPNHLVLWHLDFLKNIAVFAQSLRIKVSGAYIPDERKMVESSISGDDWSLASWEEEEEEKLNRFHKEHKVAYERLLSNCIEKCIAMIRSGIGDVDRERRWNDDEDAFICYYEFSKRETEAEIIPAPIAKLKESRSMDLEDPISRVKSQELKKKAEDDQTASSKKSSRQEKRSKRKIMASYLERLSFSRR